MKLRAILIRIHHVARAHGGTTEPADVARGAVARDNGDPGFLIRMPLIERPAALHRFHIGDEREEREYRVIRRHGKIVDHAGPRHFEPDFVDHPAVAIERVEDDVFRAIALCLIREGEHFVVNQDANATYKEQSENPASPKSLRSPTAGTRSPSPAMAGSSPDLPGLHPAIRLSRQLPAATTLNSAEHAEQQPPAHDALQRCPGRHDLYALDQRDGTQVRLTGQGPARSAADQPQPSAADPGPALPALTETTPIQRRTIRKGRPREHHPGHASLEDADRADRRGPGHRRAAGFGQPDRPCRGRYRPRRRRRAQAHCRARTRRVG